MTNTNWREIYDAAILRLCRSHPYISPTLLAMSPHEKPEFDSLATDQYGRVYVGTKRQWDVDGMYTILYHEAWHLLHRHYDRAVNHDVNVKDPQDSKIWNYAGDLEINGTKNTGINGEMNNGSTKMTWPFQPITPATFGFDEGLLAETYYDLLNQQQQEEQQKGQGSGSGEKEENQGGDGAGQNKQEKEGNGSGNLPGQGSCGSCATGEEQEGDLPAPNSENGEVGISHKEMEDLAKQTAREVMDMAKSRGNVPAWMKRWAEKLVTSKHDWKPELRETVRNSVNSIAGRGVPSFRRPSRRQQLYGQSGGRIIMPGQRHPLVKVAVVIDTSGSMSARQMAQSLGELQGVLQHLREVVVFATDAAASPAQKVMSSASVELIGGGGTDMGVGLEAAANHQPTPDLIICLTDGITPWPTKPPKDIKVVIGQIGEVSSYYRHPDWATVIMIPLEDEDEVAA